LQHCVPAFAADAAKTDECCGRKKLPCAEYSVVKDQSCRTLPAICLRRVGLARHRSSAQQTIARRRCARDSIASFAHRNFSKIRLRALRLGETGPAFRMTSGLACRPQPTLPFAPSLSKTPRTRDRSYLANFLNSLPGPPPLRFGAAAFAGLPSRSPRKERRLVENTGLEPVTSWLQTRRSPS
jgi:hypothetical protein